MAMIEGIGSHTLCVRLALCGRLRLSGRARLSVSETADEV